MKYMYDSMACPHLQQCKNVKTIIQDFTDQQAQITMYDQVNAAMTNNNTSLLSKTDNIVKQIQEIQDKVC